MKLLKEVKQKLKLLNPANFNKLISEGGLNAANMLGSGDSDDDGDMATPDIRRAGKLVAKKAVVKKKEGAVVGKQKKVNNFMDK